MISRQDLRERILYGHFDRVGQLLKRWPADRWTEIMGKGETNVRKKIGGIFGFNLRDASALAYYFDIDVSLMIQLINAEEEYRKNRKTKH